VTGRVLVSGASVAGTAVAYWLGRHGYSVTVVELHPGLRPGGQAIDVRGPALTVLDRMGLLAAAEDRKTGIRGASFVDRDGNELSRDTESTPTGGPIDNPDIELLRDDLVELLYGATQPATEYLFDDTITAVRDDGASVAVTFERAAARSFDLVIGADGLHSNVRRLVFGSEEQFVKRLGTHAAIFTVPNFLDLDYWQIWHYGDSTMAGIYSARNNTEARANLAFMDTDLRIDYRDTEAQLAEVERRATGDGWVRPQLLRYMRAAPDFYFDEMAQIVMDRWAQGRVALVGDAGYCCSPLSGQGTSVALLGAYILAGELAAAGDDYARGFANYYAEFHGYIERTQWLVSDDIPGGEPIPREEFYRVVHSITLKDYTGRAGGGAQSRL
jgi:2-polyprenyl-6-methoxyphenol hydroxylase-like FAD-dependent oxidoreductase